jgi:hypothetical protein
MLHDVLYDRLKTVIPKVYPGIAPENDTIPYIVFFQISNVPSSTASGASSLDDIRYQVSVFGASYREMESLAEAVRDVLDEYKGTSQDVTIERCSFLGENYIQEGTGIHHKALDYKITVKR